MRLTLIQDQAIAARMALIVGAETFDRLFGDVQFGEIQREVLFVYAKDDSPRAKLKRHSPFTFRSLLVAF
jgi:hypothetical protein